MDQLVAVNGDSVMGFEFDSAMDKLMESPDETTLKFFRGTIAELKQTSSATSSAVPPQARSGFTTLTVVGEKGCTISSTSGKILRNLLLENKVELYGGMDKLMNCGGAGQCGTCAVEVLSSDVGSLSDRTAIEVTKLKKKPTTFRLACQVVVQGGEITVKSRP
jgi:ferredoxin